jgi:hypothetical protein
MVAAGGVGIKAALLLHRAAYQCCDLQPVLYFRRVTCYTVCIVQGMRFDNISWHRCCKPPISRAPARILAAQSHHYIRMSRARQLSVVKFDVSGPRF